MRCEACGTENPDSHRFCSACGASLRPEAGGSGAPGARFCGACGASMDRTPHGAAAPALGSRRQVTVLFTDLSGFTELSAQIDAEDLHTIVQTFFHRVEAIVTALGGSIERYVGDAL